MEWKDTTSYQYGQRGKINPRSYQAEITNINIIVHRYRGLEGWFLSVYDIRITAQPLQSPSINDAKNEALSLVSNKLKKQIEIYSRTRMLIEKGLA